MTITHGGVRSATRGSAEVRWWHGLSETVAREGVRAQQGRGQMRLATTKMLSPSSPCEATGGDGNVFGTAVPTCSRAGIAAVPTHSRAGIAAVLWGYKGSPRSTTRVWVTPRQGEAHRTGFRSLYRHLVAGTTTCRGSAWTWCARARNDGVLELWWLCVAVLVFVRVRVCASCPN